MGISLYDHQLDAIEKMKNGCVLVGDVGTGKSRTALAYYYLKVCGGKLRINGEGKRVERKEPRPLYIITTAKKRDSLEWEMELTSFGVGATIDSWNNIKKYSGVTGAMFIFDEQRLVGYGAWVKAFLKIAKRNQWILLSATPGDSWVDYIPVFVANGFYRNKSEFTRKHCVYSRFAKYPKIESYTGQGELIKHQRDILVRMTFKKPTVPHHIMIPCEYDKELYKSVWRDRWDPYEGKPIEETGKLFYLLRKVVNSDASRAQNLQRLAEDHRRLIVFYNFTYERDDIRRALLPLQFTIGEWNGQIHSDVPTVDPWAYLVQYTAGSEGWNCTDTDTIVFWSQNYSYRATIQAAGRIDRMNTPFKDLYYYHFKSAAPIDIAIARALRDKKNFNERSFKGR